MNGVAKRTVLNAIYTVRWYTAIPAAAARFAIHANTAHTKKRCGFATKVTTEKNKTKGAD